VSSTVSNSRAWKHRETTNGEVARGGVVTRGEVLPGSRVCARVGVGAPSMRVDEGRITGVVRIGPMAVREGMAGGDEVEGRGRGEDVRAGVLARGVGPGGGSEVRTGVRARGVGRGGGGGPPAS